MRPRKRGFSMSSRFKFVLAAVSACNLFVGGPAVAQTFALESTGGLRLHNVQAEPVTQDGKRGLRVTVSAEAKQKLLETLVLIEGTDFNNGDIEAEISGAPAPDAP